jgi:WD40 repeat protein
LWIGGFKEWSLTMAEDDEQTQSMRPFGPDDTKTAGGDASPPPPNRDVAQTSAPEIAGYTILGRLGQGGMGAVWRATQQSTRREVALKILSRSFIGSEKDQLRFVREVELAARLQHPHIARVYDSGLDRGVYYYAMELVEGLPLNRYTEKSKLPRKERLQLLQKVCEAVQHAHQNGVIHRDLKPSNILVTNEGEPRVLDFGLAKLTGPDESSVMLSLDGEVVGTPIFMSPEQAAGSVSQIDTRTDVYSLGVTLYEQVTSRYPHDVTGTNFDILRRVRDDEVMRPRDVDRTVDRELEALLLKALAKEKEERYSSAGALAEDIDNYLRGEPLAARKATTIYFLGKRLKKYRGRVSVAAILMLGLVSLTIFSFEQIREQRDRADLEARRAEEQSQIAMREADSARTLANRKAELLRLASDQSYAMAVEYMRKDEIPSSVAHLARACEFDSGNVAAGALMANLLIWRSDALYRGQSTLWRSFQNRRLLDSHVDKLLVAETNSQHHIILEVLDIEKRTAIGQPIKLHFVQFGEFLSTNGSMVLRSAQFDATGHRIVGSLAIMSFKLADPQAHRDEPGVVQVWNAWDGSPAGNVKLTDIDEDFIALSPDGAIMATAKDQGRIIQLYSTKTRRPLHSPAKRLGSAVSRRQSLNRVMPKNRSALLFRPDSLQLALLNTSGAEMSRDPPGLSLHGVESTTPPISISLAKQVASMEYTPDARWLILGLEDNPPMNARGLEIDIRDANSGEPANEDKLPGGRPLLLLPDGQSLVVGFEKNDVTRIEVVRLPGCTRTGRSIEIKDRIHEMVLSPNGVIAAAIGSHKATLMRLPDCRPISANIVHKSYIQDARFSLDGRRLWTIEGGGRGRLRMWNTSDGSLTSAHWSRLAVASILGAGSHTVIVEEEGVGSWRAINAAALRGSPFSLELDRLIAHQTLPIGSRLADSSVCKWSPDGKFLGLVSSAQLRDGASIVWLWDFPGLRPAEQPLLPSSSPTSSILDRKVAASRLFFSPDSKHLGVYNAHRGLEVYDLMSRTCLVSHSNGVAFADFSPDGQLVAAIDPRSSSVAFLNLTEDVSSEQPVELDFGWGDRLREGFRPTDPIFLRASRNSWCSISWWSDPPPVSNSSLMYLALKGHIQSDDGKRAFYWSPWGSKSGTLIDIRTGKVIGEIKQPAVIEDTAFSPDGNRIVTAGFDGVARVWDAHTGKIDGEGLVMGGDMRGVEYSRDGRFLLTRMARDEGSISDGAVQIWDAGTMKPITPLWRVPGVAEDASFHPGGDWVVAASEGRGLLWRIFPSQVATPPPWLAEFAAWVSGVRIGPAGTEEAIDDAGQVLLQEKLAVAAATDSPWTALLNWYRTGAAQRRVQPYHEILFSDECKKAIRREPSALLTLDTCYDIAPEHPLIRMALAREERDSKIAAHLRKVDIDRLPESALTWDPQRAADLCAEAAILCASQDDAQNAVAAAKKALALDPGQKDALNLLDRYEPPSPPGYPRAQTGNVSISDGSFLIVHYRRPSSDYEDWNLWVWTEDAEGTNYTFTGDDDFGKFAVIPLASGATRAGFIIRKGEWQEKDVYADRFVDFGTNGPAEIWVYSGQNQFFTQPPRIESN